MKQILVFVLLSVFICWMMFSPIFKHVMIMRQAVLQKEVDLLLEIGASGSHGYIDEQMIAESQSRLAERGFNISLLSYEVITTSGASGSDPEHPVMRGTGIRLTIRYPLQNLLDIDRLIGVRPPSRSNMAATGVKMSEYVPLR